MSNLVAVTPYLNSRPFFHYGPPAGMRLCALPPREALEAMQAGQLLAGLMPVGGIERLGGRACFLGQYGIACEGPVGSVLLFADRPLVAFTAASAIAVSRESVSSVKLLSLLLGYHLGFAQLPRLVPETAPAEGCLLIGDRAWLAARQPQWAYVIDLAEEWRRIHGYPFVFARWMIRADAPSSVRRALLAWLSACTDSWPSLLQFTAGREAERYGLPAESLLAYLRQLRYVMGPREEVAQRLYQDELRRVHGCL